MTPERRRRSSDPDRFAASADPAAAERNLPCIALRRSLHRDTSTATVELFDEVVQVDAHASRIDYDMVANEFDVVSIRVY